MLFLLFLLLLLLLLLTRKRSALQKRLHPLQNLCHKRGARTR
jgi:hypothetical protein